MGFPELKVSGVDGSEGKDVDEAVGEEALDESISTKEELTPPDSRENLSISMMHQGAAIASQLIDRASPALRTLFNQP